MGNTLKNTILIHNGIITDKESEPKPTKRDCPRCNVVNALENKNCSRCGYPLTSEAFDAIKKKEVENEDRLKRLEQKLALVDDLLSDPKKLQDFFKRPA